MTEDEYKKLRNLRVNIISGAQLQNKTARTLIYGYTADRSTFHLYLDDSGVLNRVIYDRDKLLLEHLKGEFAPEVCVPDSRAYPDASDLEFCKILFRAGQNIPFTTFQDKRERRDFYGHKVDDLGVKTAQLNYPEIDLGDVIDECRMSEEMDYSEESVVKRVEKLVNGQVDGYVRAILVRKEGHEAAQRWLNNIEPQINYVLSEPIKKPDMDRIMDRVTTYLEGMGITQSHVEPDVERQRG
jgi:hypothetical protein